MPNEKKSQHTIRIFSTEACPYCQTLKAFLDEKGVEYEDINVAEDEQARQEMIDKSQQMGVPVTEIDGEIIVGFDKEKISQLLGIDRKLKR